MVVLHRTGWGAKGWTQVEQTAIRNRAFQKGWNFAKFIPLEEPLQVPERVPSAQVWIGLKHSGIVGAAAVIEARIQDAGGQVHEETLEEHAQRVQRGIEFSERREKFQWDEGVRAARQEVEALRAALLSRAEAVKRATPIQLSLRQLRFGGACLIGLGRALSIAWKQEASIISGVQFLM